MMQALKLKQMVEEGLVQYTNIFGKMKKQKSQIEIMMCFHKVTPCVPASPVFPSTSFTSAALETETNSSFSSSSPTYSTQRRAWKPSWWATSTLAENHHWATSLSLFTFMHWRRKWQPTPVFLPGESQGRGAWWAAVCGVAQSRARLKWLSSSSSSSSIFCHKGGVIYISGIIDISSGNPDYSLCFFQPSVSHDVLCIEVK